jgi:hypothetical protein
MLNEPMCKNQNLFGFCHTQLTDIEQEKNGLYWVNAVFDDSLWKTGLAPFGDDKEKLDSL